MALSPLGVLDLSIVTDLLIQTVTDAWHASPLWASLPPDSYFFPTITGGTPEGVRSGGGCQLTITLIHIEPNKFNRNFVFPATAPPTPPPSPRAAKIPELPLCLDLFYFVSAFAENQNYHQEQQAMSVVLRCFHENPIIRTNVLLPGSPGEIANEQFTLTMEIETADSISRLWQAVTAPFRLSTLYRVAAVFITPPEPAADAPPVRTYGLSVMPATFPFSRSGQLFGTTSTTSFVSPDSTPGSAQMLQVHYSPATVVPGQRFYLYGSGLNQGTDFSGPPPDPGTSFRVYLLLPPDYQTEVEVTTPWRPLNTDPLRPLQTQSRIALDLPANTVGGPPASAPAPGIYMLRAGSQSPPDTITNRTNATPFTVAARIDVPGSPPDPILGQSGGVYTIGGMGFVPGTTTVQSVAVPNTQVLLETVALSYVAAGPVVPGQYTVVSNTSIQFSRPTNLAAGRYSVRVRVNAVESPPALWIEF